MKATLNPLHITALFLGPLLIAAYAIFSKVAFSSKEFLLAIALCLFNTAAVFVLDYFAFKLKKELFIGILLKFAKSAAMIIILGVLLFTKSVNNPQFLSIAFLIGFAATMICETASLKKQNLKTKVI
ncbi:hypothetical protein PQO03_18810 [Lentisphaera profundi]|uniref:Uncharacterized protein n=1 Tax=Lentisphaera profundi TaxID=1658616 RepID=A0ABY7VUJ2_9BACT|nr:hypothetical protein [Lentisphaera profundi]WDE97880.1 hypothetical protein PQO03_18810 [Lentisphaera profundi]